MSVKGSAQLMINGFTFTRHIVKDDTIYWRCTQFRALRCPARHRQRRSTGAVEVVWPNHNHKILERRKRGTLRKILEQRKQQAGRKLVKVEPEEKYEAEYLLAEFGSFDASEK